MRCSSPAQDAMGRSTGRLGTGKASVAVAPIAGLGTSGNAAVLIGLEVAATTVAGAALGGLTIRSVGAAAVRARTARAGAGPAVCRTAARALAARWAAAT